MIPGSNYIIVKIDKQAQKRKTDKVGSIQIHPQYQYMLYYLQYGEILAVGSNALKEFPELAIGDTALFHHTIEDGEDRLLEVLPDGDEIRYIDGTNKSFNYEMFGVIKAGELIPARQFIFADPTIRPLKPKVTSDLAAVDPSMFEDDDYLLEKIKRLEFEEQQLAKTFPNSNYNIIRSAEEIKRYEQVENAINSKRLERRQITIRLNRKRLASAYVLHVNELTTEEKGVAEAGRIIIDQKVLYPFDVDGNKFLLINKDMVEMIEC